MARAYEDDLRLKIFETHGSFRKLASVFGVSIGYVEKIFRQRKQNGKGERVRHRPGPKSRVSPAVADRMVELIQQAGSQNIGPREDHHIHHIKQEAHRNTGA